MLRNKYALNGVTLPPIISDLDKSALLNKLTSLDKDALNSLDADYLHPRTFKTAQNTQ